MKHAWVYILKCADGSYYTGCITNLAQRIAQHEGGVFQGYTASRRPVKLVWYGETNDIRNAIATERQIKNWTRAKKEALISGDFQLLHELAKSTATKKKSPSTRPCGTRSG